MKFVYFVLESLKFQVSILIFFLFVKKCVLRKLVPLKYVKSTFACKTEHLLSLSNDTQTASVVSSLPVGQRPTDTKQWTTGTSGWGQKSSDGDVDWTQGPPVSSPGLTTAPSMIIV